MEQLDILRHTVDVLERLTVPYLIVGSFASIAYGESRFTQDIDIVVALEAKHVDVSVPHKINTPRRKHGSALGFKAGIRRSRGYFGRR